MNLKFLAKLFARVATKPDSEESTLVRAFNKDPQTGVDALIEFYATKCGKFSYDGDRMYASPNAWVRVQDDLYGYVVKVYPNKHLLDCTPSAYGLRRTQADALYKAILSNVPGTVQFVQRNNLEEKDGRS